MNSRSTSTPPAKRKPWLIAGLLGAALVFAGAVSAQVSSYSFAQSTVTYVQSSGANITGIPNGWDDDVSTAQVSFGFNFNFNGVTYTSCWVQSNGYITFGTTAPSSTEYRPISSSSAYAGAISAFGRDLIGIAGAANRVKFEVQGSSPNRTAVFEWRNAQRYNSGAVANDVLNFQIRLNETTNTIDLRYGACTITNTTALFCQVGLRGASNSDFNNRKTATNWSATTAGTVNTDSCTTRNTVIPTTNLNLRWTPPPACPLTIAPSPAGPFCAAANTVLTASGSSGGYSWAPATGLSSTTVANPTCTVGATTIYTVTATGCVGTATTTVTVNAQPTAVTVAPPSATICAGNSVGLVASGGTFPQTLTSGAGGSTTSLSVTTNLLGPNPFQNYYGGTKQQMMWRAAELTALGFVPGTTINSIALNLAATDGSALSSFRVKSQWSSSINALTTAPVSTGWTIQFPATNINPVVGWNTLTLAVPLVWNGTDNLLFEFNYSNNTSPSAGFNSATYDLGLAYQATSFYRADLTTPAVMNNYTMTMDFTYAGRNSTRFGVTQPGAFTWNPNGSLTPGSGASVSASPASTQTYTVTSTATPGGCQSTQTVTVSVNPRPVATLAGNGPFCASGSPQLTGTLSGTGPWSITYTTNGGSPATVSGVASSPYTINPAGPIGSTTTYAITAINDANCAATAFPASVNVVVNPLPTVTCGSYGPVCVDAADITLGGSPAGGTWSGTGVTGNSFDPSVGTQTLTYSYTDGNSCTNSCQTTINVNPLPVVTCGTYGPVCVDAADITLGGSPAGGTWSGTGVTGNSFDPSVGTQTLTYSFTDGNGCSNSCQTTITVNPLPVVTCGTYGPVCVDAADITLGGSPAGGTWSGTGVTGNSFDPSAGTQTLTYSYTDGNGCSARRLKRMEKAYRHERSLFAGASEWANPPRVRNEERGCV